MNSSAEKTGKQCLSSVCLVEEMLAVPILK